MSYIANIGLETHVQLSTKTKLFCSCANDTDTKSPNQNICEVCMGHPGAMPVVNRQAVKYIQTAGVAFRSKPAEYTKFDRKHYFYPDLTKGYQISQFDLPFCSGGKVVINFNNKEKEINLIRIHLEDDAGKLTHPDGADYSLVDFNRAGSPLIEIVSDPDISSGEEAEAFAREIRRTCRFLEISEVNMEKGEMRFDVNISLRKKDDKSLGSKVEIKNLNSFRSLRRAIDTEIRRQSALLDAGKKVAIETRGFNDLTGETIAHRAKEDAPDYRYFPEPDLPYFKFFREDIEKISSEMPELPHEREKRFKDEYALSIDDAKILTADDITSKYFEQAVSEIDEWLDVEGMTDQQIDAEKKKIIKLISNWILSELFGLLKKDKISLSDCKITPENLAELVSFVYLKKINSSAAQDVLKEMMKAGQDPSQIIEEGQMAQIDDAKELESIIEKVISDNPDQVESYKSGNQNLIQFFIGQVMKATKGQANPEATREILLDKLK